MSGRRKEDIVGTFSRVVFRATYTFDPNDAWTALTSFHYAIILLHNYSILLSILYSIKKEIERSSKPSRSSQEGSGNFNHGRGGDDRGVGEVRMCSFGIPPSCFDGVFTIHHYEALCFGYSC